MFETIRTSTLKSLVHLAVSFGTFYKISVDNGDLGLGGGVLSKLQRLLTFSVVIGDIDHTRATNSTLLDIPWNGCTHVRELEKESYAGNGGVSGVPEEYYPCSECRQICHQLCSRNRCNRSWHREPCEGFCDAEEAMELHLILKMSLTWQRDGELQ